MLSVIIPSYKDPCLPKTIESILTNFTGSFEVLPVIDGYQLRHPLPQDSRVRPIVLPLNAGMREAINTGVQHAQGEYIMRTDEHCVFSPAFDDVILATIQDDWIVTARRYFLDPDRWQVMDKPPVDYEKLIIKDEPRKFAGVKWKSRTGPPVDETMAMQGSCWVMARSWWDKVIGRLDSAGYGCLYQDSVEMVFKTWQAGGKLMLNKNAWYAHKHREFKRTHNYPNRLARESFAHALSIWEDYYRSTVLPKWRMA